jgi:thioredoxin-like negative regulator of GroEL
LRILVKVDALKDFESYTSREALVVFSAPDTCIPCRRLAPQLDKLAGLIDYPIVYVDIGHENDGIGNLYEVQSIPLVYKFEDGKPVRTIQTRIAPAMAKELAA